MSEKYIIGIDEGSQSAKILIFDTKGHIVCEVTSVGDKIFFMLPQVIRSDKYANALETVLNELSIPFEV